jgi:alkylation response protein AidB-like acyl-CoA dehydrogenase
MSVSEATAADVRAEVRQWLEQHFDPESSLAAWRNLLADSGWACPTWPTEWYGRGLPARYQDMVREELDRAGAPGTPPGVGMGLAAPTILEHGSDQMKSRLLRPTITGEYVWCQLFSEPGSGSDLAGLTTRAERDGDEWVINGQKVWNTSADHADYGMLLARTNWDVPKHRGITYFAIPMRQPGVEVRPLRQSNGYSSFNEVFMTDARVPADMVIGNVDQGWTVALATLAHERRLDLSRWSRFPKNHTGRVIRDAEAEAAEYIKTYAWYPQRAGRPDLVVEQAQATGRSHDPIVRQEAARVYSMVRCARWTAQRAEAAQALGRPPGPEGSLAKLNTSNIARAAAKAHSLIIGASGLLAGPEAPVDGKIAEVLISVPAQSIAGGTDEIQRNIIGERVLGLPKEPQVDRDVAFRQVRRNA